MPEGIPARYPLSTQQAMCLEDEDNSGFILPFAMRVKGQLDTDALQGALNDVVVRHEVLRTSISGGSEDGDARYQTILPPVSVPFTVHDVDPAPGQSRDELADELLVKLNAERMDMSETPLLRAALHRFDDSDAVLTIMTHHSAGDGWSCNLLRRDLAACYKARTTGVPHELPEIRQYREHGAWQQEWVGSERGSTAREYWARKLGDARVYTMPADRPNGEGVLRSPYATVNFVMEPEEFGAVEAYASGVRCSGWHAVLAAGILLAERLRSSSDITLMTNTSGRADRSFHNTIGWFADFVPLRMNLHGCTTFRDVLLLARSTCMEAYRNLLPITEIEAGLPDFTRPNDEPLNLPFIFNYSRPVVSPEEIEFAEGAELITLAKEEPSDRGGWCIWSMSRPTAGGLRGVIEYSPDLVDSTTVELWVAEFINLLSLITDAPDQNWKGQ